MSKNMNISKDNNYGRKPELLAPAGDMEKLMTAVAYGADAVYLGGQMLGLRAYAGNFNDDELRRGIEYAHSHGVKVYVTVNIFAHNSDLVGLENYFKSLEDMNADALIISDPGVFNVAHETVPDMNIHISTQANNTNYKTVLFWSRLGAKRIVLARELTFTEISEIRDNTGDSVELEAFVHGAMCISYSGRCLLSGYMTGRDSNRGECTQPCRYKYYLTEHTRPGEYMKIEEDDRGTYIFNSKDLCMAEYIPELIKAGVGSFKIEGRMKSPYYVATAVKAYREAIDDYFRSEALYESKKVKYLEELSKSSHRGFTVGFYPGKPGAQSQNYDSGSYIRYYDFIGLVVDYDHETGFALVEQRNKFSQGDKVEFLTSTGEGFTQVIDEMYDEHGERIYCAPHPQQILKIRTKPVKKYDMLRKMC